MVCLFKVDRISMVILRDFRKIALFGVGNIMTPVICLCMFMVSCFCELDLS